MVQHMGAAHTGGPASLGVAAIACSALTLDHGGGRGVFDLDLRVNQGEVFGLIGPRGAGKTTAIRLLMDLIRPGRGRAAVLGMDAVRDSLAIKRRVGYLPGEPARFPGLTAGGVIALAAGLRGGVDPARIELLAKRFQLDLGRGYEDLDRGGKQKAGLIRAFMHEPELLILDEPTNGLEPAVRPEFHALVDESAASGATVFLSSLVLSEVEQVCDRIGLIRAGRLLKVGTLAEFRSVRMHRIEADFTGQLTPADVARLPGVSAATIEGGHMSCTVRGSVAPLLASLARARVTEMDSHELSLEEVFRSEGGAGTQP